MVKTILKYVIIAALVLLVLMWLWAGGFSAIARFVRTIPNPIDIIWGNATSSYSITLPWQSAIPQGPDISGLTDAGSAASEDISSGYSADDARSAYEATQAQTQAQQSFGTPSPYVGYVTLSQANATESSTAYEYLELEARQGITPLSLSGWSLQSAVSGVRVPLPGVAAPFIIGTVNKLSVVTLSAGAHAIIVSGPSPIGVSFRENRCSGYLAQTQTFEPSLQIACPASSDLAPLTADNLHQYGSDCMDFARSLPQCSIPTKLPSSLTAGCDAFIKYTFTYGNCVNLERSKPGFELDTWRIYLASASELWGNQHDIIRLLDAQGRTVDAISY